MSTSLIYRSAAGYELVMRALYGRHYAARLSAVADQVPANASVLELCAGPGALYRRRLRGRIGAYTGVDLNPRFVTRLRRMGASALQLDLSRAEALPIADVVIMQASLYHFLPDAAAVVDKMLAAARLRAIVAEPVRNLTSSRLPLLAALGRRATDPGAGPDGHEQRFDEAALDQLMGRYGGAVTAAFTIPGGREKVFVIDPRLR
ncbi:MAG: hypothetical protein DLM64_04620 [Solirubrobacterales bacterium]|nr:MAG: hypothetical protein DLM64_04620 [Solirubrobacterales bacterium]